LGGTMKKEAAKILVEVGEKTNEGRKERELAEDQHRKAQDQLRIAEQEHRLAKEERQLAQKDILQAKKEREQAKQALLQAQEEHRSAQQEHHLAREERQLAEQNRHQAEEERRRVKRRNQFANQGVENYGLHEHNRFPGFSRGRQQDGFRGYRTYQPRNYSSAEDDQALKEIFEATDPPPRGTVFYYQSEHPNPKAPGSSQ
jgi:hypothetical protein